MERIREVYVFLRTNCEQLIFFFRKQKGFGFFLSFISRGKKKLVFDKK
jgi:hypothetical protein